MLDLVWGRLPLEENKRCLGREINRTVRVVPRGCVLGAHTGSRGGKEEARNTPELASWPLSRGLSQCGRKALGVATTFLLQLRTTYKRTLPSACSKCIFLSSRQSNRFRTCGDWTGLDTATRKFLYTPKLGGPSLRVTPTLSE